MIADYLEPGIGSTVLRAGQSTNIPLTIFSSVAITNPFFALEYPAGRVTGFALSNLNPAVGSAFLQNVAATQSVVFLTNAFGQSLLGTQQVARLNFVATTNQTSAFIPIFATDLQAKRLDGTNLFSLADGAGRIVVIGEEPLLEAAYLSNGTVRLILYGPPGSTVRVDSTTQLLPVGTTWNQWTQVVLTNIVQPLSPIPPTNAARYFRGVR